MTALSKEELPSTVLHGWQNTISGVAVNLLEPTPDMINIEDIAHALSMLCRWGGHVDHFYSVAQHCVHVSESCHTDPAIRLWGLLHDATEAYVIDLPSPLKHLLPEYKVIENRFMAAICEKFGLPPEEPASVVMADRRILVNEHRDLGRISHSSFVIPYEPLDHLQIQTWWQPRAKAKYLEAFEELSAAVNRRK